MLRWLPLGLIALAAFWLRTRELDRRPMHADEANQAVKVGELLDAGSYAFDPRDHHGPTLYYAGAAVAWLRGERSLATLTETTVRLVPAIFGTISVVLIGVLGTVGGASVWTALIAAAFVALSPPSVYYSRYFIQETLLVTFTLGAFVCARAWWRTLCPGRAIATGVCVGLMQATKANAPLFIVAALIAVVCSREREPVDASTARPRGTLLRQLALAIAAAIVVILLFYSSFGTHLAGIRDAFATYGHALTRFGADAPPTGHEKPWWYYLSLFGWVRRGGFVWEQLGFALLAAAGVIVAFKKSGRSFRWAAIYTVIITMVLSALAYKTPWHAVHFVPGMALLAAATLTAIARLRTGIFVAAAIGVAVLVMLAKQTRLVAFQRPADLRNPFAYVHSSSDVLKFRASAEVAIATTPNQPIWVISEEVWPLPWYLRGLPRVGYPPTPPENCDGALVISSTTQADAVRAKLRGRYRESFLGLRPGVILVIFTPEP